MGTILPIDHIKTMCLSATRRSLIILITDFEIFNWQDAYPEILKIFPDFLTEHCAEMPGADVEFFSYLVHLQIRIAKMSVNI